MDPTWCGWMRIPRPSVRVHLGPVSMYTSAIVGNVRSMAQQGSMHILA